MIDSETFAALLEGERQAWDTFVGAAAPLIHSAAARTLLPAGRSEEIEEVVQDVFVKLCRNDFALLRGYDPGRAKLSTWISVIASTTSIDHLRRRRQQHQPLDTAPESVLAVDPPGFERLLIPRNLLSPRQAAILTLLYDKELEVADVAEQLGIAAQTVRSLHHKALVRLRGYFGAGPPATGRKAGMKDDDPA